MCNPSQKGAGFLLLLFYSSTHVADSRILADTHGKTDGRSRRGGIHNLLDKTQLFQMTGSELAGSGQGRDSSYIYIVDAKKKKR